MLKWIFPAFDLSKKLLVWDSFRAHISENTKKVIKSMKNLYTAVIPGGCTMGGVQFEMGFYCFNIRF